MKKSMIVVVIAVVCLGGATFFLVRGCGGTAGSAAVPSHALAVPPGGFTPAQALQLKIDTYTAALKLSGRTDEQRKAIQSELDRAKKDLQALDQK